MRLLVALLLSGCSLYFGDSAPPGHTGHPYPDAAPWIPDEVDPGGVTMVRCDNGEIRGVVVPDFETTFPGHGAGWIAGACTAGCYSAAAICQNGNCDEAIQRLCTDELSSGHTCELA